jgi:ankyrin repeat protein
MEEVVTWLDDWLECGDAKLDSSGHVVSECAAVKAKDALEGSQGCVSEWFHMDSRVEARCQECREMTLLIAASMGGQKALVARLLERCRSTPARLKMTGMRDADGYTALMWAAERGEFGVVAALLKAGALTDPPWPSGAELQASPSSEAPLSSEAKAVSTQGTYPLISTKGTYPIISTKGTYPLISTETALTIACKLGHASIVFALVRAGASTSAVDGDGASALECVARRGHVAAAKALISKQQLSSNDPHALGALIVAAMRGHGAMVELLLLSGLEADALDGNGLSARSAARMEGREEVLAVIDGVDRLKRAEASS